MLEPPSKKIKTVKVAGVGYDDKQVKDATEEDNSPGCCKSGNEARVVDSQDKAMLQPQPILADEIIEEVKLAEAYVCNVHKAKSISKIVKYLAAEMPLEVIGHLKRIKKDKDGGIYALLCLTDKVNRTVSDIRDLIPAEDIASELGSLKITNVPMIPPITRKQFESCAPYWPTNFHEDKELEKTLRCENFSESMLNRINSHMQHAIAISQISEGQLMSIGAVVVDPSNDEVIAVGTDLRHENTFYHCTMVAIDLVARSQGGGAYNDITLDKPLYHRPPKTVIGSRKDDSLPYLCTGYDLYITREPCAMCSMALTHSRISRVFYDKPVSHGAVGSRYKIHCQKGLNHHYKVFRTFSNTDCDTS